MTSPCASASQVVGLAQGYPRYDVADGRKGQELERQEQ